jgi:type IV secretory pathway VirB2 component (pilin)
MFKRICQFLLAGLAFVAFSPHAWASTAGAGLPMEAPIQKLQQSLCGPIAFDIALCAAMAAFGAIIFLGHMFGDFVRTCLYIALCISTLAAAPGFASALGINDAVCGKGGADGFVGWVMLVWVTFYALVGLPLLILRAAKRGKG